MVNRVEWDPCRDGELVFDITGMKVLSVERIIEPRGVPMVRVTFAARLVEVEVEA